MIFKQKSFAQRQNQRFLASDYFAEPIQLNFKGMNRFFTRRGAIVSLLVRISVLIFAVTRILSVISGNS